MKIFNKKKEEKMNNKIFDMTDVSDIPKTMREYLKVNNKDTIDNRILHLFEIANMSLTIDEVCVGYYRTYREEITRNQVRMKLWRITSNPKGRIKLLPGRRGLYALKEEV